MRARSAGALVALLVSAIAPVVVQGQEQLITLAEAIARAEGANPELQAAAARVDAQMARGESVRRMRWPRVGVASSWSRMDLPAGVFANKLNSGEFTMADFDVANLNSPEPINHLGSSVTLEVPIDIFGKLGAMARGMSAYGDAAAAGTADATQEIRLRVTEAYRRAELAGRAVTVTERTLEVARARELEIGARVETGTALIADLLRARARRRAQEADVAERRGQREMALAGLARLLGATDATRYLPREGPPDVVPLVGNEATWVALSLRQRPSLEAARRKAEAAAALVSSERKALLPDVGAFGQAYDNRIRTSDGSQTWAVGIGMRWTPFDGSRSKREAAARAEQHAALEDIRAATDQVRLEVSLAYRRALAARERHAAASGGSEEGREAFRVVQERRKAGMATLTDELETETAALGAALLELGAAAEVAMADAALLRAAGEI